jgi:hypothetical protein
MIFHSNGLAGGVTEPRARCKFRQAKKSSEDPKVDKDEILISTKYEAEFGNEYSRFPQSGVMSGAAAIQGSSGPMGPCNASSVIGSTAGS